LFQSSFVILEKNWRPPIPPSSFDSGPARRIDGVDSRHEQRIVRGKGRSGNRTGESAKLQVTVAEIFEGMQTGSGDEV
jgi:hypothetical protein